MSYYLTDPIEVLYLAKTYNIKFIWEDYLMTLDFNDQFMIHDSRITQFNEPSSGDSKCVTSPGFIRSLNSLMHEDHTFYIHEDDVDKIFTIVKDEMKNIFNNIQEEK